MVINFDSPKTITYRGVEMTLDGFTVVRVVDLRQEKIVRCLVQELGGPTILWEGEEYDAIGQWTDTDVDNRLLEIYNI